MAEPCHCWHKQQQYVVPGEHRWGQAASPAASSNEDRGGSDSPRPLAWQEVMESREPRRPGEERRVPKEHQGAAHTLLSHPSPHAREPSVPAWLLGAAAKAQLQDPQQGLGGGHGVPMARAVLPPCSQASRREELPLPGCAGGFLGSAGRAGFLGGLLGPPAPLPSLLPGSQLCQQLWPVGLCQRERCPQGGDINFQLARGHAEPGGERRAG